jgi:hypothetical protein
LREILGSRRKILFIEGTDTSLDKPLYSLVFPDVSIVAKSSCRDVEHSVSGIRDAGTFHWVHAFGIVDNDRRRPEDVNELKAKGVYALSVYAVESIYYNEKIQSRIAERHAAVTGTNPTDIVNDAKAAALLAITPHIQRLAERVAERAIRESMMARLPLRKDVAKGDPINVQIDVADYVAKERARLQSLVDSRDVSGIVARYPVRETPALNAIAGKLGFRDRDQYESAVRKMLMDDDGSLQLVRSLLGTLPADLAA